MTARVTVRELDTLVERVNALLGFTDTSWNTVGAVTLYGAYGSTAVHRIVNTSGGITVLSGLGTKREAALFLRGMLAGLEVDK